MKDDLISRQAVLDYIDSMPSELTNDGRRMIRRIRLTEYISDTLPSAEPEIVRCKDCKHRPLDGEDTQGFGIEFPDEICPCQSEDGWYNWRPDDDWFCANADMRGDTE